jgi:hypothetical protein
MPAMPVYSTTLTRTGASLALRGAPDRSESCPRAVANTATQRGAPPVRWDGTVAIARRIIEQQVKPTGLGIELRIVVAALLSRVKERRHRMPGRTGCGHAKRPDKSTLSPPRSDREPMTATRSSPKNVSEITTAVASVPNLATKEVSTAHCGRVERAARALNRSATSQPWKG